jgi:hypothetical protein
VIKWSLYLAVVGVGCFVLATVLELQHFSAFADKISQFGAIVFLGAFAALFACGIGQILSWLLLQLTLYFSVTSRLERQLNFYLNRWEQQVRIFEFKKAKLLYLTQKKRKYWLKKWGNT